MRIAVTYEDGNIFQHFGRTEQFKVYDIEDGKVVKTEILSCDGTGHEELADLLYENAVKKVICGGLGDGAQNALRSFDIEVFSGNEGSADEAIESYLAGTIKSTGVNCDHHDHEHEEGHACHCHEEGEEGCGCGHEGCGCGCGEMHAYFDGKNVEKTVRVHYRGTFNDGTQFDSSYDRGEPLEFICGVGMMIEGFDRAVAEMDPGQIIDIHLTPEMAYGMPDPANIITIELAKLPGSERLAVGDHIYLTNGVNQFPVTVTAVDDETITFDANHEMAGKELNFTIELVEVL